VVFRPCSHMTANRCSVDSSNPGGLGMTKASACFVRMVPASPVVVGKEEKEEGEGVLVMVVPMVAAIACRACQVTAARRVLLLQCILSGMEAEVVEEEVGVQGEVVVATGLVPHCIRIHQPLRCRLGGTMLPRAGLRLHLVGCAPHSRTT